VSSQARTGRLTVGLVAVWVLLDQLSKHWAENHLRDGRVKHVIWTLDLDLSYNSGMAFGRAKGLGPVVGIVALVVVVGVLISLRKQGSWLSAIAVGLVVGGAIGNLCDRLFRGRGWFRGSVIDFIDLRWWPVFNVADMGVTIGGVLLLLEAWRTSRVPGPRTAEPTPAP